MLGHDVHRHLTKKHIRADPRCGSDPCFRKNISDQFAGESMRIHTIQLQILCRIYKDFIYRIGKDIFRGDIPKIDPVDLGTEIHVV